MTVTENMNFLLLLVTFLCVVTSCLALGTGAPESACISLLPVHRGTSLQDDDSPYTVSVENIGANKVRVTISSPIDKEIKGFMLQARSASDRSKFITGKFKSNEMSKTVDCFRRKQSSLTHVNTVSKSQVITEWTATTPVNEDIIFRATVARSYAVYWKDIDSKPIRMRTGGQTPSESTANLQGNRNYSTLYDDCFKTKGCFGLPNRCVDKGDCEVLFTYERSPDRGIRFAMHSTLEPSEYMAMGLSDDDRMGNDFVTECLRSNSNNGRLRNSWNDGKSNVLSTETNDNYEFTINNVLTTCVWIRPYIINYNGRTYDLANKKYHILLAKGPFQDDRLRYHTSRLASGDAVDFTYVGAVASAGVSD